MKTYLALLLAWSLCAFVGCREKTISGAKSPLAARDDDPRNGDNSCVDVTFSISNQDRWAPAAMTDILLDSEPVFHGTLGHSRTGDYVYLNTHVHRKKVHLEVRSETTDGALVKKKNIWVGDKAWIVVTRVREFDGDPELRVVVSYESPWPRRPGDFDTKSD